MAAVTFTFIRHGESTDNLRGVWAGWKDAGLSIHGMNQAQALGASFDNIRFTAICTSPLKRALMTAQALRDAQEPLKPPMTTSPLLQEQHFGVAEGKHCTLKMKSGLSFADHVSNGIYPVPRDRVEKFPEGESSEDLARRAEKAIREVLLPCVWKAAREGTNGVHVAVVSHGFCIREIIAALVRLNADVGAKTSDSYRGLLNTAWTRVTIQVKGAKEGEVLEFTDSDPPPVVVRIVEINRHEHIYNIVRQKGIGSAAYDPKQTDIRAHFGGGTTVIQAQEHSESNAQDEVEVEQR